MHGNVSEWCQDWWSDYLPGGIAVDPQGPASGYARVIRGGNWGFEFDAAGSCRSAHRNADSPEDSGAVFGFRVVLAPGQP